VAAGAPPSARTIAAATAGALAVAMLVLFTAVLPAEYGIDPLGTGEALGLTSLNGSGSAAAPPIVAAAGGPVHPQSTEYRVDTRRLTVPSLGSIEFKYELAKGAAMLYSWSATAPLEFDFHTEPAGKPPQASETFERGEGAEKRGAYIAPYDGIHGWYWENLYDSDVTITLEAAGAFSEARLFLPNAPAQRIAIPVRALPQPAD
jgi:hypothetical protein